MKKILELNHNFVQHMMIMVFPIGCAVIMVVGVCIIASQNPNIKLDVSAYPQWVGYLMLYGGFILGIDFVFDGMIVPIIFWIIKRPKKPTLQDRIRNI